MRRSVREHKMKKKGEKCTRKFPIGTVSVLLVRTRTIIERQAVQWVDGLDKIGSDGIGNEDLGAKLGGDE